MDLLHRHPGAGGRVAPCPRARGRGFSFDSGCAVAQDKSLGCAEDEPFESAQGGPLAVRKREPRGFSLVELLVVIAVIALLVGIMAPTMWASGST